MIAVIDNYDSFTYNLVHYFEEFSDSVDVYRNDEVNVDDLEKYSHIVISPGPGLPQEIDLLNEVFTKYASTKRILGVCLGLQAMVQYYNGTLYNLSKVLHGRQGECRIEKADRIFNDIQSPFLIGHYHSWGVNDDGLPEDVEILGRDMENRIMVIKHKYDSTYAVQFHPESILCPNGKKLLYNWLKET